jgi:ABC-type polysaccharide/polyol phosphate export permease
MLAYVISIWGCRNFWLSLVANDLHLRYRRSVLGVGWSLLHPLATTLVLGSVFHEIFHRPIREYLPYLLCGLGCWAYLTGVITQGCQTYIQAEPYIRQHPLPMAIYPLRTALGMMIHFVIALALVAALSIGLRGWAKAPDVLHLLPALLLLLLFGWSAASLAGYVNTAFRDTQHILDVAFQILFYLTPIIYPIEVLAPTRIGCVVGYNPLSPFIDLVRDPVLLGRSAPAATWSAALLITLSTTLVAALSLRQQQRRVILYL